MPVKTANVLYELKLSADEDNTEERAEINRGLRDLYRGSPSVYTRGIHQGVYIRGSPNAYSGYTGVLLIVLVVLVITIRQAL
jgi:hypothetical protein